MSTSPILNTNNLQSILAAEGSNSSGSSGSSSVGQVAQDAASKNLTDFLSLLTTEMQNQDPTQPLDNATMMQQMAALSNLQIQNSTNTLLQSLVGQITSAQVNSAVGYIGKSVQSAGNSIVLDGGKAEVDYSLPSNATSVTVSIKDSSGNTVFSGPGTTTSGLNKVFWNGSSDLTNGQAPDGVYTYSVTAKNSAGQPITATTFTTGVVTAVDMNNGSPLLMLGTNLSVPLSNVKQISDNPFTVASSQTPASSQSGN